MLKPMIEVAKKHSDCLSRRTTQRRIRDLYRELIKTLLSEADLAAAQESMREFASWDRNGVVTIFQRILLRLSPGNFDRISRQFLYPIDGILLTHGQDQGCVTGAIVKSSTCQRKIQAQTAGEHYHSRPYNTVVLSMTHCRVFER